ncbi:MAG: hypothetical protein V3S29_09730, partial [bacterium]
MLKQISRAGLLAMAAGAFLFLVSACGEEPVVTVEALTAPVVSMTLPASLTVRTPPAGARSEPLLYASSHDAGPDCDFGQEDDPFGNAYGMTRFLVGLSQSQSCFADWLMTAVTTDGAWMVNEGQISTGNTAASGEMTFIEITQSADEATYGVWFYWDDAGATPRLYLTWTNASATDATGQMIWVVPDNDASLTEPDAVRVDFSRSTASDVNEVYIRFPVTNQDTTQGFRVEVTANKSGASTTDLAKGLLGMGGHWAGATPL